MSSELIISLISLAVAVLGPIICFYASTKVMEYRLQRAETDIAKQDSNHETLSVRFDAVLTEVRDRLARIEGLLQHKEQ